MLRAGQGDYGHILGVMANKCSATLLHGAARRVHIIDQDDPLSRNVVLHCHFELSLIHI